MDALTLPKLLYDDGTSIVVLTVVTELKNALEDVGALMDDNKTGQFVQRSQKAITPLATRTSSTVMKCPLWARLKKT